MKKSFFILSFATLLFAACSSDDSSPTPTPTPPGPNNPPGPVEKKTLEPNIGGYNEPNQVYVDLSTAAETVVKRDTWDLGFASGANRVILNGSIGMAVKQLPTTNIDEVQQADPSVALGFTTESTFGYVDDPTGVLNGNGSGIGTAIAEISSNDSDNMVYLVNLGKDVPETAPNTGSPKVEGDARGWKKIRITRNGNDYVLQYADLDATTHQTVTISKKSDYNFTFFSFNTNSVVDVQPQKDKWDLNFTVFTNYTPNPGLGQGVFITYIFSDFVTTNIHGNTRVYKLTFLKEEGGDQVPDEAARDASYDNFTVSDVEDTKFAESSSDQRVIGGSWRGGGGPGSTTSIYNHIFYVVKDADGNLYKIKFLALTNDDDVRGYPIFEYELLK